MSQHLFDVDIAVKYGVNIAIFLKNIAYWINFNRASDHNFHDGRYWTYREVKAYQLLFPYWTEKQIRTIIESSINFGLLQKGNYNKQAYDRTLWYALTDEGLKLFNIESGKRKIEDKSLNPTILPNGQMDPPKRENGFDQKGGPIPNKQPDVKNKSSCEPNSPKPQKPPMTRSSMRAENEKKQDWAEKPKAPLADVSTQSTAFRSDYVNQPPGKLPAYLESLMNKTMEKIQNGKAGRNALRQEAGAMGFNSRTGASLR